jgi:hypothetical protein
MPDDWSWRPDDTGLDEDDADTPCAFCGAAACERSCTGAILAQQAADYPGVQAQAQRLYAAYVTGLGPLGTGLPPWGDLVERQQYAWRCAARAGEEDEP